MASSGLSETDERLADVDGGVDYVAFGVVFAAILVFIGTGSQVGPAVVRSLTAQGPGPDALSLNAFLLNIAIIIFGWSRYRELSATLRKHVAAEREARHLAETDPLTGFLNRRSFNHAVERLRNSSQARGNVLALMIIDIDNFKQVNDYNGHATGDLLLSECAMRIASVLPLGSAVGRIGGDEFAVALEFDPCHPVTVDHVATALVTSIGQTSAAGPLGLEITASVGIARSDAASNSAGETDARALAEMADIAMYHAKRQGRNAFYWYDAPMGQEMRTRTALESCIKQGIAQGEFVPYYERQIDLKTGELTGFEMLARWNSPQFGLVTPDVFIPVAEAIGAISAMSEHLIRQALENAKGWDPRLTLAVNISPLQLRDPWFAEKLLRMLVEANFSPRRLEIEITESCLHQNLAQVTSLITSLKNQGIRVTLDDFGTGYSSLAQLRSLPFDRLKIDRSFVSNAADNRDSAAIVRAIAMLGKGLDLPVTAEGIENNEVLEHLRQYEDLTLQGYLYGHPRPADDLSDWLDRVQVAEATSAQDARTLAAGASRASPRHLPDSAADGLVANG